MREQTDWWTRAEKIGRVAVCSIFTPYSLPWVDWGPFNTCSASVASDHSGTGIIPPSYKFQIGNIRVYNNYPSKFFSALQSYCSRSTVGLLSYDSRSTLIQLGHGIFFCRVPRYFPHLGLGGWLDHRLYAHRLPMCIGQLYGKHLHTESTLRASSRPIFFSVIQS